MAKQTTVILVDDLDGSEATEQVEFAVDGRSYEIDLSAQNSAKARGARALHFRRTPAFRRRTASQPSARPVRPRTASTTRTFANGRRRRA